MMSAKRQPAKPSEALTAAAAGVHHHRPALQAGKQALGGVFQAQHRAALRVWAKAQQTLGRRVHAAVNHDTGKHREHRRLG